MDLPEELAILILKRSPPSSLLRFKRVCKSWRRIISTPGFLQRSILVQNKSNETSLAIIEAGAAGFVVTGFTYGLSYTALESPTSRELGPLPTLPEPIFGKGVTVVGSCREVVCFAKAQEGRCVLWNSTTGESRFLSPHHSYNEELSCYCFNHLGMGYYNGHLKVIKISTVRPTNGDPVQVRARIYELSSDSWREISPDGIDSRKMGPAAWDRSDLEPGHVIENDKGYSWRDGRMYSWICFCHWDDSHESECCVVSFDMASETFTSFSSVIPVKGLVGCVSSLVLNDLLGFCLNRKSSIELWVMLEHGAANSWAKLWSIQMGLNLYDFRQEFWNQSLKFWKGGLLMLNSELDRLLWCDLSDPRGMIRTLPVHDFSNWCSLVAIFGKARVSVNGESSEESSENHMNVVH